MAAVVKARKKPADRGTKKQKPIRLTCPAGSAVVTVKPGRTLVEVLTALLEQEQTQRGAA
jgi:hypothetical protein